MQTLKRLTGVFTLFLAIFVALFSANNAWAMKKCTDANGKTYYGDSAQATCDKSKVTTMNDRGAIKHDNDRPKTENELALEAEATFQANEKARMEREAEEERIRILSVYETEEDIDRQLENQLGSVNTNIAVHKTYISKMKAEIVRIEENKEFAKGNGLKVLDSQINDAKMKIEESKKELVLLAEQSEAVKAKFEREKDLFRTLRAELAEG